MGDVAEGVAPSDSPSSKLASIRGSSTLMGGISIAGFVIDGKLGSPRLSCALMSAKTSLVASGDSLSRVDGVGVLPKGDSRPERTSISGLPPPDKVGLGRGVGKGSDKPPTERLASILPANRGSSDDGTIKLRVCEEAGVGGVLPSPSSEKMPIRIPASTLPVDVGVAAPRESKSRPTLSKGDDVGPRPRFTPRRGFVTKDAPTAMFMAGGIASTWDVPVNVVGDILSGKVVPSDAGNAGAASDSAPVDDASDPAPIPILRLASTSGLLVGRGSTLSDGTASDVGLGHSKPENGWIEGTSRPKRREALKPNRPLLPDGITFEREDAC